MCERRVDRSSPFFRASPVREAPAERVTFRLLELGEDEVAETRALFVSLCERKQALSPDDREALIVILRERGPEVLSWLPEKIPVRENVAVVFGTLFQGCAADVVLPIARRYMTTATDVLRFIAVLSGTDGSLQAELRLARVALITGAPRFVGRIEALKAAARGRWWGEEQAMVPIAVKRFKVARLRRPLRRALLTLLEEIDGETDVDLSVGLYDERWSYVGVCSYYALQARDGGGAVIATSAGDLQAAPWPDGATELVDLDCAVARAAGVRYAVMVVNNYRGMPFSQLARGFAGLMLRDDPEGRHFDPRTVALKFSLSGENGIFMPLVLDVRDSLLHWLDVQAAGEIAFNNVASSNQAITKVCPALISYFASGTRPSLFELALLHAAARCRTVILRGPSTARYTRRAGEDIVAFHARLVRGEPDEHGASVSLGTAPVLAALFKGDVELPAGSASYALFRERITPSLAASDLVA